MKNRIVGGHVSSAKIVGERRYSIISDYLGTPVEAYDEVSKRFWKRELDIYGRVRIEQGEVGSFLYQGQYLDTETRLAYHRFRYNYPEKEHTSVKTLFVLRRGLQTCMHTYTL